jgi:hypothetical protein
MRPWRAWGRPFVRTVAGLGISLLLVSSAARGDTWKGLELDGLMKRAPWRFGPFRVQPSLVISNAGIDSNIFYSPDNPVKDFTITAGPAATIYLPIQRRFVLSFSGSPQYLWYSKTEQERAWNYYLRGAAQLNLRSVFLSLDGSLSDAREHWNTELDIRPRRKEVGVGGSALVKLAWKTSFALGYHTAKYDYESIAVDSGFNVREQLNRRESYGTFSFYHEAGAQSRFFLDFEYGRYDFEFATEAALKDSQSYAGYAGYEFTQIGSRVRGRVRLGYKKFDLRSPEGGPNFQGLVGDSQLSVRLARPLAVRGSFVRDVRFSLWYGNAYFVETRPGIGVSVYPFRLVRLDYDFSKGQSRYPVAGGGGPDVKRRDDFTTNSAGLYVRIGKTTALGFVVSFWQRDSNLPAEDDKRTFFGLNLTYDF